MVIKKAVTLKRQYSHERINFTDMCIIYNVLLAHFGIWRSKMAVSYKKLFKLMIDRNLKKKDLKKMTGLSYTTIAKLEKSETVRSDVFGKICCGLGCQLNDIAEIIQTK